MLSWLGRMILHAETSLINPSLTDYIIPSYTCIGGLIISVGGLLISVGGILISVGGLLISVGGL